MKGKRSDAKFCSHNCQVKYHNRKKQQQSRFLSRQEDTEKANAVRTGEIDNRIVALEQENSQTRAKLDRFIQLRNQIPVQIRELQDEMNTIAEEIEGWINELTLDTDTFFERHFEKQRATKVNQYHWTINSALNIVIKSHERSRKAEKVEQAKEEIIKKLEELELEKQACKTRIIELQKQLRQYQPMADKYIKLLALNNDRIKHLEGLKFMPVPVKLAEAKNHQPATNIHQPGKGIGGADLLNMEFDTFRLGGELGRFLGELDRNMTAFALTGDSGAGKSYFSFELAKVFVDDGFKAKYFSLEEGLGKLTQDKVRQYNVGNDMTITGYGSLRDVRKDAKNFDLIAIDSFQKLNAKPEEFERLRQDFPKTIFIIIFQKTTAGTMRGGSSIRFNSSATIDVVVRDGERIAVMEKGRYGTIGWEYSISEGKVSKVS